MSRGAALVAGMAADAAVGDPARLHPVAGFGSVAAALERALWAPSRRRGALHAALLVGGAAMLGALAGRTRPGLAALAWCALGGRSLGREAEALAAAVERGDLEEGRRRAPALVGRDPSALEGAELCRAAIESVAENSADAVVGALVWGALAGGAGVAGYRAANTLDAMVGHRTERYERFGFAAARLDDLLGWPGARLGAGLTCALAPLVGGDCARAWRTLRHDGRSHPSPNAGPLEAAFAGALGVRLGGVNRYGDRVECRPTLGTGGAPGPEDVRRAVRLARLVGWGSVLLCAAAADR